MDFVIKISEDYSNVEAQIINPTNLEYTKELASSNFLTFNLAYSSKEFQFLTDHKRVALYTVEGNEDTLIWSGVFLDRSAKSGSALIKCLDGKGNMRFKTLEEDKNYVAKTPTQIVEEILAESLARGGQAMTFETDILTTDDIKFKRGDDYESVLDQLALLFDAEWDVVLNNVVFKTTIGIDRTQDNADFVELVDDVDNPNETSLADFEILSNGTKRFNALTGKAGTSFVDVEDVSTDFPRVEVFRTFNEGNLAGQANEALNKGTVSQQEINLEILSNIYDFRMINVGDLVKVRINKGQELIDTVASVKVISKNVNFKDNVPNFTIDVSDLNKIVNSAENYIATIEKRVTSLELQ